MPPDAPVPAPDHEPSLTRYQQGCRCPGCKAIGSASNARARAVAKKAAGKTLSAMERAALAVGEPVIRAEAFPRCPTPCDGDCEQACHEVHQPPGKRAHYPDDCIAALVAAVAADAVAGERQRIREGLAALTVPFVRPGRGTGMAHDETIRVIRLGKLNELLEPPS